MKPIKVNGTTYKSMLQAADKENIRWGTLQRNVQMSKTDKFHYYDGTNKIDVELLK